MKKWIENLIRKNEIKKTSYIHFDIKPDIINENSLILEQSLQDFFEEFLSYENVRDRGFWPLINFIKEEIKTSNGKKKIKKRSISYTSHFDSFIYSYYSYLLDKKYNKLLVDYNINNSILAYRKIPIDGKKGNKNNINFAKDSFEEICKQKNCIVLAFDITGFFDNLNHDILKQQLQSLLGGNRLPDDYFNVFESITKYTTIDSKYIRKMIEGHGNYRKINKSKYNLTKKNYKKNKGKSILFKNRTGKGIPQGTLMSGILANIYLTEFDIEINKYINKFGGKYFRYSDDLLLVVPILDRDNKNDLGKQIKNYIFDKINKSKLEIQEKKTDIYIFKNKIIKNSYSFDKDIKNFVRDKNTKSVQFLGFTFDGKKVLIRNKTLSGYYKKMNYSIKRGSCLNVVDDKGPKIKGEKFFLGKLNKRFINSNFKGYGKKYGNFLGYAYTSNTIMDEFCKKYNIENGIKKQLSRHTTIYRKYLKIKKLI